MVEGATSWLRQLVYGPPLLAPGLRVHAQSTRDGVCDTLQRAAFFFTHVFGVRSVFLNQLSHFLFFEKQYFWIPRRKPCRIIWKLPQKLSVGTEMHEM